MPMAGSTPAASTIILFNIYALLDKRTVNMYTFCTHESLGTPKRNRLRYHQQ